MIALILLKIKQRELATRSHEIALEKANTKEKWC
jgi:hypothetical protein